MSLYSAAERSASVDAAAHRGRANVAVSIGYLEPVASLTVTLPTLRCGAGGVWSIGGVPVDARTIGVIEANQAYLLVGDRTGMVRSMGEFCPELNVTDYVALSDGARWFTRERYEPLAGLDEAVVAWGAWGAFYWLRMTKQVGGRWGNAGASAHALKWLAEFRLSQTRQAAP